MGRVGEGGRGEGAEGMWFSQVGNIINQKPVAYFCGVKDALQGTQLQTLKPMNFADFFPIYIKSISVLDVSNRNVARSFPWCYVKKPDDDDDDDDDLSGCSDNQEHKATAAAKTRY